MSPLRGHRLAPTVEARSAKFTCATNFAVAVGSRSSFPNSKLHSSTVGQERFGSRSGEPQALLAPACHAVRP
jgi:hypothetical protein